MTRIRASLGISAVSLCWCIGQYPFVDLQGIAIECTVRRTDNHTAVATTVQALGEIQHVLCSATPDPSELRWTIFTSARFPSHTASGPMPRRHAMVCSGGWQHTLRSQGQQSTGWCKMLTRPGPNGRVVRGSPAPHTMYTGEPHKAATCANPESLLTVKRACRKTFQYAATVPLAVQSVSLSSGSAHSHCATAVSAAPPTTRPPIPVARAIRLASAANCSIGQRRDGAMLPGASTQYVCAGGSHGVSTGQARPASNCRHIPDLSGAAASCASPSQKSRTDLGGRTGSGSTWTYASARCRVACVAHLRRSCSNQPRPSAA